MIWTLSSSSSRCGSSSATAFPKIAEALEKRANAVRENIEASERQRAEADEILKEYRARLKEAREQADDISARARKSAENAVSEATAEGKAKREELVAAARKDIEAETRRSLDAIRREVADLTVLATEKITREVADRRGPPEAHRGGARGDGLLGSRRRGALGVAEGSMEEIARVYGDALFAVAKEEDKIDEIRSELGEFADALDEDRDLQVFFFSPYFSSQEKRDGIEKAVDGASDQFANFLSLLAEKHRMPAIFRIRTLLRRALGRGEQAARGAHDQRRAALRQPREARRRRDRAPDGPQDRP